MRYWLERDRLIDTEPLTKLTGVRIKAGPDCHRSWSRWWDGNKDKPRVEWLRAARAAPELARLGDESAVPLLLEGLESPGRYYRAECAAELARMGRDEGFLYLGGKLGEEDYFLLLGRYPVSLVEAMTEHPEKGAPIVLRHLKRSRSGGRARWVVSQLAALLGPAIRVPPPLDVADEGKLDAFIAAADAWCAARSGP